MSEISVVKSHWYHPVANFHTSTQEFYAAVEQALGPRQIPGVAVSRFEYKEGGLISGRREYLRVKRERLVFDICAAPFGTGYFFSWWLAEIPLKWGLLRLAATLLGMLIVISILTSMFAAMFGNDASALVAFPLAFVAFLVLVYVLGDFIHKGAFGPDAEDTVIDTPFIGWCYVKLYGPFTYYKTDTMLMYQSAVSTVVQEVVGEVLEAKGVRPMTELERKPIMRFER